MGLYLANDLAITSRLSSTLAKHFWPSDFNSELPLSFLGGLFRPSRLAFITGVSDSVKQTNPYLANDLAMHSTPMSHVIVCLANDLAIFHTLIEHIDQALETFGLQFRI